MAINGSFIGNTNRRKAATITTLSLNWNCISCRCKTYTRLVDEPFNIMSKEYPEPWIPIDSKVELAIIGKLQEELGELQAILARSMIQGIYEKDPDTGAINKDSM